MIMATTSTSEDMKFVRYTAKQMASGLIKSIALAHGYTSEDLKRWRLELSKIHFHDSSGTEIAWNDVQAIQMWNAIMGEDVPVPAMASEGFNKHGHTSEFDGGLIVGLGPHDHRDAVTGGGFAFAVYHNGTALPQQPWAI